MKLSEIEAAGEITTIYDSDNYKWTGIVADRTLANYGSASDYQDKRALDFEKSRKVYTAEQMQEYAKAKVLETLKKYGVQAEEWSEHEAELAYKQMTKFIFEDEEK